MNQFEKWAKEKGYDLYRHTNDAWEYGIIEGAEKGWRAALEWALAREMCPGLDIGISGDTFREELEDETEKD